jgi:hypothetical protein
VSFLGEWRSRYGRPVTLLTTDWHPWFSYEWWNDIGVPTLGALGSIAVGAGAIVVALHSNRIAQRAVDRETKAREDSAAAAKRTHRAELGLLCSQWLTAAVDEITHPLRNEVVEAGSGISVSSSRRVSSRSSGDLKQELDVRAASVGQHGVDLVKSIADRLDQMGNLDNSRGRALTILGHRYSLQSIAAWVADSEAWWVREQEARRYEADFDRWKAHLPAGYIDGSSRDAE